MKATIEVPDELYRHVKARAALEGRTVREVTTELYQRWLEDSPVEASQDPEAGESEAGWIAGWERIGREITRDPTDPRSARRILLDDRR